MKRLGRFTLIVAITVAAGAACAAGPDGRGTGMAGAFQGLAEGADGLWWNPAVLGTPLLGSVNLGGGLSAGNNALSLYRLAGIAQNDADAKKKAIDDIAKKGTWNARIEMLGDPVHGFPCAAVTVWRVGLAVYPHTLVAASKVSPDAARLALNQGAPSLAPGTAVNITGQYSFAQYNEIVAGYAHDFGNVLPKLALRVGASVKYLMGTSYELNDVRQSFTVGTTALPLASADHFKSTSGSGFTGDIGAQLTFLVLKLGVAVKDIGASIRWTGSDTGAAFNAGTGTYTYTYKTGAKHTQDLPTSVAVALSGGIPIVGTKVVLGTDLAAKTKELPALTRIKVGAEQPLGLVQFQAGYATKSGAMPAEISAGVGVGLSLAIVSVHLNLGGALATDMKGGGMGLTLGASF